MNRRFWDGKNVHVSMPSDGRYDRRRLEIGLTTETAGILANNLRELRRLTSPLSFDIQELLTALDYVLVADPASSAQHRRMEASKGMTPDGGYRRPETTDPKLRALRIARPGEPGFPLGSRDITEPGEFFNG